MALSCSVSWGTHVALTRNLGPARAEIIKSQLKIINHFTIEKGLYLQILVYEVKCNFCKKKSQMISPFG